MSVQGLARPRVTIVCWYMHEFVRISRRAGDQLQATLRGQVLLSARLPVAFERVVELGMAQRPGESFANRLFLEVWQNEQSAREPLDCRLRLDPFTAGISG